jgi:hypothetical protein
MPTAPRAARAPPVRPGTHVTIIALARFVGSAHAGEFSAQQQLKQT